VEGLVVNTFPNYIAKHLLPLRLCEKMQLALGDSGDVWSGLDLDQGLHEILIDGPFEDLAPFTFEIPSPTTSFSTSTSQASDSSTGGASEEDEGDGSTSSKRGTKRDRKQLEVGGSCVFM
jgi:hypothetical protein